MYLRVSRSDTGMAATNATNESFVFMEQLVSPSRLASRLELDIDWPTFLHFLCICGSNNLFPASTYRDWNCLISFEIVPSIRPSSNWLVSILIV